MNTGLKKTIYAYKAYILMAALGVAAIALILFITSRFLFDSPLSKHLDNTIFEVGAGSSLTTISQQLKIQEIFSFPAAFIIYVRMRGLERSIQPGEYEITGSTTMTTLLQKMINGDRIQYRITLVEGWTLKQALEAIWENKLIDRKIRTTDPKVIARLLELDIDNAEGMIFPDTYFFTKGASDISILNRAYSNLQTTLNEAWGDRLGGLPYSNSYEALIMASIIEKESSASSEKGHIAGVFVRRIELGMRLQSDPTVIYGMKEQYNGDITRNDLEQITPYNTYRINGLPPTPIALAGRESILASVNPLQSEYLYFVSKGDGSHYFSVNLEEHNAAVARFRRTIN